MSEVVANPSVYYEVFVEPALGKRFSIAHARNDASTPELLWLNFIGWQFPTPAVAFKEYRKHFAHQGKLFQSHEQQKFTDFICAAADFMRTHPEQLAFCSVETYSADDLLRMEHNDARQQRRSGADKYQQEAQSLFATAWASANRSFTSDRAADILRAVSGSQKSRVTSDDVGDIHLEGAAAEAKRLNQIVYEGKSMPLPPPVRAQREAERDALAIGGSA
jgi:hypothetical protein